MFLLSSIRKSIKAKFIITFGIILLILSTVSLYNNYSDQKADALTFAEEHILTNSEMLAFSVGAGISEGNFDLVITAFNWAKSDENIIYIDIIDDSNTSLVTHNPRKLTLGKEIVVGPKVVETNNYLTSRLPISYKLVRKTIAYITLWQYYYVLFIGPG